MDRERLRAQLMLHEGLRTHPYTDTVGKLTIGVGRNLTDVGITHEEAMMLLDHNIDWAIRDLMAFTWFPELDPIRQRVLVDMCFNLGLTKLRTFTNTLAAVGRGDYAAAARGMLASKWARQVGARADRLAKMMLTGQEP